MVMEKYSENVSVKKNIGYLELTELYFLLTNMSSNHILVLMIQEFQFLTKAIIFIRLTLRLHKVNCACICIFMNLSARQALVCVCSGSKIETLIIAYWEHKRTYKTWQWLYISFGYQCNDCIFRRLRQLLLKLNQSFLN